MNACRIAWWVLGSLAWLGAARGGGIGICNDPNGLCVDPCPSDLACYEDGDCPEGYLCPPGCAEPFACGCDVDSRQWMCDGFDCAGRCIPIPEPTGPRGYTIIDLGTLGGWTANAKAVNNFGQVVGEADTRAGYRHAFLWEDGVMVDLGVLGTDHYSYAVDVNNHGEVVCNSSASGYGSNAFLWRSGQQIPLTGSGGFGARAAAINDGGEIVGYWKVNSGGEHAFLWENGVMTDLYEALGIGGVYDINAFGDLAIGVSAEAGGGHAAVWSNGTTTDLGTLGGLVSYPVAINDRGEVIGLSQRAPGGDGLSYWFLWMGGQMIDLDKHGGYDGPPFHGINNCGQLVVGANLYNSALGGFRSFYDMLPAEAGWYELQPIGINDRGQIVGYGTFGGLPRAFLMSPVPGDLDVDGDVDLRDFARFQDRYTGARAPALPGCERADLDGDADVDASDWAVFSEGLTGPR